MKRCQRNSLQFRGTMNVTKKKHEKNPMSDFCSLILFGSVQDSLDPQDFGFLDPDPDPQKYADLRIRIKGGKYHPKTEKKLFYF